MATEKIRIDYEVNKKQLDESNKSLKKTAELNDLTQKEVDQTNQKFEDQNKTLSKTNKAFTSLGGKLQDLGNRFQIAGKGAGDMAAGLFKSTTATSGMSKAMKILKFAVASTGIGLLVIALGSLVTYFTKTQKGSDLLAKGLGAIGAVVDTLIGRFAAFGGGIASIFSGDFAKGAAELKAAFSGLGEELVGAVKGSNEFEEQLVNLRKREIEVTEAVAGRTKIIQEQLLATKNNTLSLVEQKEALDKVQKLQEENEKDLLDIAQKKFDLAKKDIENTPKALVLDSQLLAKAEAKAALEVEIANSKARQRDTANRQTELANRALGIAKATAAEEAKTAAALKKQKEERQAILDEFREAEEEYWELQDEKKAERDEVEREALMDLNVFKLEQSGELEKAEMAKRTRLLANEKLTESQRALIIKQSEKVIVGIKEQSEKAQAQLTLDREGVVKGALNRSVVGTKAVAVYETGVATKESAVQSYKALAGIPGIGPALGFAAAAAAVAYGTNTIAGIISTNFPTFEKGGKIGGNLHSSGGTIIEAEKDEFVMSRKATSKYGFDFMDKINNLELNDFSMGSKGASVNVVDTGPIAEQLKKMPQNVLNVDSEGFEMYQRRGQNTISQKLTRYST